MDCLFCGIVGGSVPSDKVYEDEVIYAFRDISPEAKCHVLVVPKKHIGSVDELEDEDGKIVAHIFSKLPEIGRLGGCDNGYRVITNCGDDAGQSVHHLHFHVLGGEKLPLHVIGGKE